MCYGEEVEVTPLVPKTSEKNIVPVEMTVLPNPTFLVYVGETQAKEAEFALLNQDKEPIYYKTVSLKKTPGIVMFTLPEPMTEEEELLKESEKYQWVFSLSCEQGGDASGNLTVEGWVELVSPAAELAQKLANASEREKPAIFAEYGFWMDAAGTLAQLRQDSDDPQVQENWQSALNFAGLDQLIEEPLLSHSGSTVETNAEN